MRKNYELLKELSEANGIGSLEKPVRDIMEREFLKVVSKEDISYDGLGSIVAKKVGDPNGPKVLFVSHMDEVGMVVSKITDDGFIKFQTVGDWWGQVMLAQQMNITTNEGKKYLCVVGSKPPHILTGDELSTPTKIEDMYLDLGVSSKQEVEQLGIKIGNMITPAIDFHVLGNDNYLLGKAWDNRVGCAITIEVLKALQNEKHPNIVYASGSVEEEVGLRGGKTVAGLVDPDICIVLDTSIAKDLPETDGSVKLGKGPAILFYDSSAVGHVAFKNMFIKVAEELNIPYQLDFIKKGGTDNGPVHTSNSGCPCISLCIETRYIHSHTSIIHYEDYMNAIKLTTEIVKRLNREVVNKITYEE